jgi:hypothetical protein
MCDSARWTYPLMEGTALTLKAASDDHNHEDCYKNANAGSGGEVG